MSSDREGQKIVQQLIGANEPLTGHVARPPYRSALIAGAGAWVLYVLTLAPTTAFWDTSEYITTAHIVGIPHPPGNPLFVFLGRVWSLLLAPLGLPVAVRINLLAATTSAAATGFLYLVAYRVLTPFLEKKLIVARIGAGASALIGATAFSVWNQSNVNEKVYTLSVLIIAAISWLAIRWHDNKQELGSERYLLWTVFLLAIGSTNHPMSLLPAPALVVFLLVSGPQKLITRSFLGRAVVLGILGLSFNFVLPIRAALDPVVNEGDPSCESVIAAAGSIYGSVLPGSLRRVLPLPECPLLADNLARVQYQTPPVTERKAPLTAQLEMYLQYFDWQWSRGADASETPSPARLPFTVLFFALGCGGLWAVWRSDRAIFSYVFVLVGTLSFALVVYLNFRYGYSLAPQISDPALHEVRERDYFYVAGFLIWGILAGVGLAWTWHIIAGVRPGPRRYLASSPILLVAAIPLVLNWSWASRAGDYVARDWAFDLLASVEPYGVLFTNGDNDTFPLWYLQEVEGIRQDVTVIVGQYLFTDWYPKQLKQLSDPLNQRPFDPTFAPGLYEDPGFPLWSITSMTDEQMGSVGSTQLAEPLTLPFPQIAVTYPAGTVLQRGQQLALRIIHDSIGERPIFFSAAGGMLSELGMERWGVRHGLATKLEFRSLDEEQPARLVQGTASWGGFWFDLPRSLRLYQDVYQFRGLIGRPIWQDRATLNIPLQYYALAGQLADVGRAAGEDEELVAKLARDAAGFQVVAQGGVRGIPGT
ncbi:MAG: DUF2723 domain-containing protein [Gemmatimonadota bacterium]|nr:DUF2723 domain-containing protein [Gemmatimonadota bacterium]